MANREPQTWQFLRGDLEPHRVEWTDLRNDNAGDQMSQVQSIVLRYLENLPAEGTVDLQTMAEDISGRYPFQGENIEFFREAVNALKEAGWVQLSGNALELNKVARVTARYLMQHVQKTR